MGLLDDWFLGEHTASGITRPAHRRGSGPGVVVISEIPGITEDVIAFSDEVVGLRYPGDLAVGSRLDTSAG